MKRLLTRRLLSLLVFLVTVSGFANTAFPSPFIKVNGSEGPVAINTNDAFSITVALDPHELNGTNADWWLVYNDGTSWSYYNLSEGWQSGLKVSYQGLLFDLSSYRVNGPGLSSGSYTFYFGFDTAMNGTIDMGNEVLFYDSVVVNVQ